MSRQHIVIVTLVLACCVLSLRLCAAADRPRLKDVFKNDFLVGAAIGNDQIAGEDPASLALAAEQFNAISPENVLKWETVHPEPEKYNFEPADRYVEFGQQHGMFILGHTLVWHNQTPAWVFKDDAGKPLDRDALLKRMRDHIHTVVGRYKGRVNGWDVVNEAVEPNGKMRRTKWLYIIGEDYIEKAYQFAHEADPDAELYYNDYNEWHPEMRKTVVQLVQNLKSKGIRVDGIGMQGHWALDYPDLSEAEQSIEAFAQAAGKVNITELDISALPDARSHRGADIRQNVDLRKKLNPYPDGLPDDMQQKLAERYAEIFKLFHEHRDQIGRVTFWGVHDGVSWLNYSPVAGRTDYPLLFDRQLQPKPAFDAVIKVAR